MAFLGKLLKTLGQVVIGAILNAWHLFEFSIDTLSALIAFFRRQGFRAVFKVVMQQVYFTGL